MSLQDVRIPHVIGNHCLHERLGAGFSGAIYRATNIHTNKVVAIKVQHKDDECPTNRYERGFYPDLQGGKGMPTLWAAGVEGQLDYLVIDLLGPSLDNLYRKSDKNMMDLGSVCTIAMQILSRLEFMHMRGILHRDIQLGNAVVGLEPKRGTIYMIDFGFSKRYIDPLTKKHIPDSKEKRDFIGNYWFTSVNVHCRGRIPTRRDDLEAAALMFIHLLTPDGLHWTRRGVPKTDHEHDRLKREKLQARPEQLCHGMPVEFEEFLRYCRKLRFAELPDYERWREEFRSLAVESGYPDSDEFVWPPRPPQSSKMIAPRMSPSKPQRTASGDSEVERVLQELANMQLGDRPVLGDRLGDVNRGAPPKPAFEKTQKSADGVLLKQAQKAPPLMKTRTEGDVLIISDSSAGNTEQSVPTQAGQRQGKAAQLRQIAADIGRACDNLALARLTAEYARVLRDSKSRSLTKDGFAVLDALHRQLADPSVFVVPIRQTRPGAENAGADRNAKADKLARLRSRVTTVQDNASLGKVVAEFGQVMDRSTGRTITIPGLLFLDHLALRLKELG